METCNIYRFFKESTAPQPESGCSVVSPNRATRYRGISPTSFMRTAPYVGRQRPGLSYGQDPSYLRLSLRVYFRGEGGTSPVVSKLQWKDRVPAHFSLSNPWFTTVINGTFLLNPMTFSAKNRENFIILHDRCQVGVSGSKTISKNTIHNAKGRIEGGM